MNLQTNSVTETRNLGKLFSQLLTGNEVVALIGELGSGKTVFVQGLAEGLEINEIVHSPSFTLVNEYHGKSTVYHFDFYRLKSEEEVWNLGWQDYLSNSGILVIEWADRFPHILPGERIEIRFTTNSENENKRFINFNPIGEKYTTLLKNQCKFAI